MGLEGRASGNQGESASGIKVEESRGKFYFLVEDLSKIQPVS